MKTTVTKFKAPKMTDAQRIDARRASMQFAAFGPVSAQFSDEVVLRSLNKLYDEDCEKLEARYCRSADPENINFRELCNFAPTNTDEEKVNLLLVASNLGLI